MGVWGEGEATERASYRHKQGNDLRPKSHESNELIWSSPDARARLEGDDGMTSAVTWERGPSVNERKKEKGGAELGCCAGGYGPPGKNREGEKMGRGAGWLCWLGPLACFFIFLLTLTLFLFQNFRKLFITFEK